MSLPFLEKLLQVLAQGGFSSTYKYAVLLALIDLCVEAGQPPSSVTTALLARRVVELYWPQVRPFGPVGGVLGQNRGVQATIARLVAQYRAAHPDQLSPPRPGPTVSVDLVRLYEEVEWVLVEYPLPRLQRVGGGEERFLYTIGWDESVTKSAVIASRRGQGTFDNRILFVEGAAANLVALAAVVRPLVQQQWLAMVRSINGLPDAELESFLFGAERVRLGALQRPLRALQNGRCFYCFGSLSSGPAEVDHFLPWARHPDDGVDNLLLAHDRCNGKKLHFLADLDFGARWADRSATQGDALDAIAAETGFSRDRRRTFGAVATVYQGLPEGMRLWQGGDRLRRLNPEDLDAVRAFGRGLLLG